MHTHGQTDRQTDRKTDIQTYISTSRAAPLQLKNNSENDSPLFWMASLESLCDPTLNTENTDYNGMSREEDNTNITAYINRSEIKLYFDVNELVHVNFNWKISILNVLTTMTCAFTVLLVNSLVLLMLKMKENTLVDRMVLLDCFANISTIVVMFLAFPIRVWGNTYFCLLATFFRGFVVVLNRLTINIH